MSGTKYLLDTNIILYISNGNSDVIAFLNHQLLSISVITEMELLSFPSISKKELSDLKDLISQLNILPLDERIKDIAINVRRKYKLKLPDSIIVATAMAHNLPLITADKQLNKITGVEILIYDPTQKIN